MDNEEKRRRFEATQDEAARWYEVVQPCRHCGEAVPIEIDTCSVCVAERSSGRMERLEREVESLRRQLAEARKRIAEMEPHSRWHKHREEINRRKNGTPCACEFDDDDEPITQCAFHADLRRELAEARALLAERKWNPTEHPQ